MPSFLEKCPHDEVGVVSVPVHPLTKSPSTQAHMAARQALLLPPLEVRSSFITVEIDTNHRSDPFRSLAIRYITWRPLLKYFNLNAALFPVDSGECHRRTAVELLLRQQEPWKASSAVDARECKE
jgi:hypothetical protein